MYSTISKTLHTERSLESAFDLVDLARDGLTTASIDSVIDVLEISVDEMVALLPISRRTLERYEPTQKLSPELSDRLIQIAKIYSRTLEVFGDHPLALGWLKSPCKAFGDVIPLSYLNLSSGFEIVIDELGRIDYGVYS
ncbi:MAG: antitoxin Xre/MbcA/ParS toxin-binding domain-containing protein [Cyanobacteria bacterium P01_G01_bin.49]